MTSVKEHYSNHLANFYSWQTGDTDKNSNSFKALCIQNDINPSYNHIALDLGAGNGIQSFALASLGFKVKAVDFNDQLLEELRSKMNHSIETINEDIRQVSKFSALQPELIVCCGDTLPHLASFTEIRQFIFDIYTVLHPKGKVILTFRDYSMELQDTQRFIPVKNDSARILTCVLEYFTDKIRVTDLLHEQENGQWVQKVSSYYKTRILKDDVLTFLKESGFENIQDKTENRIITLIAQKN